MKKIIIATISLVMAASMLAACAPKEDNNDAETTTAATTVEDTTTTVEETTTSVEETTADTTVAETTEATSAETTSETTADTTTAATTTEATTTEATEAETDAAEPDMEFPNNKNTNAGKVAAAIGGVGEWTAMVPPYDPSMIPEKFLLNPADYKSVSINEAMMSAAFAEIIVLETKDGKVADAVKVLEARKEKAINQDAFYPGQDETAENAVIDSEGNFAFMIMGSEDNAACAKAAKEAIKNLK